MAGGAYAMEAVLEDSPLAQQLSPLSPLERMQRTEQWFRDVEAACYVPIDDVVLREVDVRETEFRVRKSYAEQGVLLCLCGSLYDLLCVLCCECPRMACGCCGDNDSRD